MKLVDANVLLYATDQQSPQHRSCKSWLEGALGGTEPVGFAWTVLLAFLRLSTKAQVFESPLSPDQAFDQVQSWTRSPAAVVVEPGDRHLELMREILSKRGTAGNLTSDAHLAAMALEIGAAIVSCDGDFSRFSGVEHINPVEPQ